MLVWIDRILLLALVMVVAVLVFTSWPAAMDEQTLDGQALLVHMMASGVLVMGLPVFALFFLRYLPAKRTTSWLQILGYIATLAAGLVTIVTVFLCMLPVASTHQMHSLMSVHGWAGFMMIPAIVLLLIGTRATRSASHPHS
ncbi:hypothetical protein Mal15_17230 [Stieleria maiorica]|uniref:DUF4405 domain-containing protein n=1 Tax=Stieleria maiorica TaxID=2795974 RepID=A0A5B9M903_9BACT|nr:hypothetical protein [Stieleria maiorica]QEF97681.1 hypothetical protein Mal15_17230 [Stieleria maiorica]